MTQFLLQEATPIQLGNERTNESEEIAPWEGFTEKSKLKETQMLLQGSLLAGEVIA